MYFFQGFILLISMIISFGPQNLFVVKNVLEGKSAFCIAFISAVCDALVISLGIIGLSSFIEGHPFIQLIINSIGIYFLTTFIFNTFYHLKVGNEILIEDKNGSSQIFEVHKNKHQLNYIFSIVSFSLLNPMTWIETVGIVGMKSISLLMNDRIFFALGAITASFFWFFFISYSSKKLGSLMKNNPEKLTKIVDFIQLISVLIVFWILFSLFENANKNYLALNENLRFYLNFIIPIFSIGLITYLFINTTKKIKYDLFSKIDLAISHENIHFLEEICVGSKLEGFPFVTNGKNMIIDLIIKYQSKETIILFIMNHLIELSDQDKYILLDYVIEKQFIFLYQKICDKFCEKDNEDKIFFEYVVSKHAKNNQLHLLHKENWYPVYQEIIKKYE